MSLSPPFDLINRLVQGSGSVPDLDPRSYQAEGYAMVSSLTILKYISSSAAASRYHL
jgi:hypothetical protein